MRTPTFVVLFLSFLSFSLTVTAQGKLRSGKDLALFISVNEYDAWLDLKWPNTESANISRELVEKYGFKAESLTNPNLEQIIDKLGDYINKKFDDDSQLLIYFSGHGAFIKDTKEGFFIPKDGKKNDRTQQTYLAYSRLKGMINRIGCPHILLVLDACYSGTFDESIAQRGNPANNREDDSGEIAWRAFIQHSMEKKSRLLLASSKMEQTPDQSRFAKEIYNILRRNAIKKKVLKFDDLVYQINGLEQEPHMTAFEGHESGGDFVFFPIGFEKTKAPAVDEIRTAGRASGGNTPKKPSSPKSNTSGESTQDQTAKKPSSSTKVDKSEESSTTEDKPKKEKRGKKILNDALEILAGAGRTVGGKGIQTERLNEYVFTLKSCTKAGSGIDFNFEVTSENQDRVILIYGGEKSTIRDEKGFKYNSTSIKLGNTFNVNKVEDKLVKDIPYSLVLNYRDVTSNPQKISLMELRVWTKESGYQVINFRDVPVK